MARKRKRWRYRSYRNPRTTQERRANGSRKDWYQDESDYKYVRKARSGCNLPNAYDDIGYSHQKSWKKYRKSQYHPKWVVFACPFCGNQVDRKIAEVVDKNGKLWYYCSRECYRLEQLLRHPSWCRFWK